MVIRMILLAMLLFPSNAYSDVSTKELLKSCDEKTIVMGRVDGHLEQVGEKLDGYCRGYIEGHLSAQKEKVCLEPGSDTHFLVSLLNKYVEDNPKAKEQDAGDSLSKALLRAYKCE